MTAAVALGGAGGFVGRALARALARGEVAEGAGAEGQGVGDRSEGAGPEGQGGARRVVGDGREGADPEWWGGARVVGFGREGLSEETCPEVQALVWAGGGREGDAAALAEAHVAAPARALAIAARRGARRALYLSSGEVYGAQAVPFREDMPRRGATAYAQAKARGEDLFQETAERLGVRAVVLRAGVVYGPGQAGMLLGSLRAALVAGRRFAATAGEQTRDFLHVDDLVRLVLRCLAAEAPAGLFNAGTGVETRVADAALGLAERLAARSLLDLGALAYRPGEVMRYALDPTRAREVLGFAAEVELEAGLDALAEAALAERGRAREVREAGASSAVREADVGEAERGRAEAPGGGAAERGRAREGGGGA